MPAPLTNTSSGNNYTSIAASGTQNQQSNTSGINTNTGTSSTAGTQANTYAPGAQALQGQGNSTLAGVLASGQLPPGFTNNSAAIQAADDNFKNNSAPTLAAQFGAGSPVIGSDFAQMNEQLQGQLSREDYQNFNGIMSDVQAFAYQPTGSQTTGSGSTASIGTSAQNQNVNTGYNQNMAGSSTNSLVKAVGGGLFSDVAGGSIPSF